jgi:hypothetical protein
VTARRATALLALAAALATPAAAHADGDPASDVLLTADVYAPYFPAPKKEAVATLKEKLAEARAAGFPMKVAMIQTQGDLGAYPELFEKPAPYAKLLASEIVFKVAKPHLVVVMPNGLAGRNLGAEGDKALAGIEVDKAKQSDGLVAAATEAVEKVAAANGHPLESGKEEGDDHTLLYVMCGVIVLLGIALVVLSIRMRRPSEDVGGEGDGDGDGAGPEQDRDERG